MSLWPNSDYTLMIKTRLADETRHVNANTAGRGLFLPTCGVLRLMAHRGSLHIVVVSQLQLGSLYGLGALPTKFAECSDVT